MKKLDKKSKDELALAEARIIQQIEELEQMQKRLEESLRELRNRMGTNKDDSSSPYCREGRKPAQND